MNGVLYYAGRLVWMWVTGEDPGDCEIDHGNRHRDNNAWHNLSMITAAENRDRRDYNEPVPTPITKKKEERPYDLGDRMMNVNKWGVSATARLEGVSRQAVSKWVKNHLRG